MKSKIYLLAAIVVMIALFAGSIPAYASGTQTINATNNTIANLVNDGSTNNVALFQKLLDSAKDYDTTVINIPAGDYLFYGRVLMRSNITINFAEGAKFISKDWANFSYFSYSPGYDSGVQNVTWNNAYFSSVNGIGKISSSIVHAKNINYNNVTWYRALGNGNHLLDIMGSSYFTVNNSRVIGANNEYNSDQDTSLKEAFQISYATRGSLGGNALDSTPQVFDGLPSHHITIQNTKFLPVYDDAGNVISLAPTPVGEHGNVSGKQIHDILIKDNYILDPVAPAFASGNNGLTKGVIHFLSTRDISIENNVFEYKKAPANDYMISFESYGRVRDPLAIKNVTIKNNTFKNTNPHKAYVLTAVIPGVYGTAPIDNVAVVDNKVMILDSANHKPFWS